MENGRGFVLVRGLPMERYTKDDAAIVFWGLACHLGRVVSQNRYGDLIGHVRDAGLDMKDPSVRFYETRLSQDVHNDLSDWISLMCLRQAKSEGVSTLASAAAIHDVMMAERPDLVRVLYEPLTIDRRNEPGWPEEESPLHYRLPVFTWFRERLTTAPPAQDLLRDGRAASGRGAADEGAGRGPRPAARRGPTVPACRTIS